ncbi:MAG: bifunctional riboflavin kinase/FAD synthetase [Lentisphaeria bacterium]
MLCFASTHELISKCGQVAIACGNFDGLHIGHQKLLHTLLDFCTKNHCTPAVFTFLPHPRKVLHSNEKLELLTSHNHKLQLLERYGINHVVQFPFTSDIAKMSPEKFCLELITPSVKAIFAGTNWRFGSNGSGSINLLKSLENNCSTEIFAIDELTINHEKISSSNIRKHLKNGDLATVAKLLGRNFSMLGKVVKGDQIAGKTLGFPTANLAYDNEIFPPNGVYAGFMKLDHTIYHGVIVIGNSPTFNAQEKPTKIEFHAINFNKNIYDYDIEIEFIKFIRPEMNFSSIDALISEIKLNLTQATEILLHQPSTI